MDENPNQLDLFPNIKRREPYQSIDQLIAPDGHSWVGRNWHTVLGTENRIAIAEYLVSIGKIEQRPTGEPLYRNVEPHEANEPAD